MIYHAAAGSAFVATFVVTMTAQTTTQMHPGQGGSPHVRSEWTIQGADISIEYGRPFLKGRSEIALMPHGEPWRTGADEATTFTTNRRLTFGTLVVPPGTYTLYTLPGAKEWQLIVSKRTGQWGVPYPEGQDLGRVPMKVERIKPVEQLTISIDETPGGGTLRVEWGTTRASAPFTVG